MVEDHYLYRRVIFDGYNYNSDYDKEQYAFAKGKLIYVFGFNNKIFR